MSPPVWIMVGVVIGLIFGWAITRFMGSGKDKVRLAEELESLQREHARYKEGVDRHFIQTSELVNTLTESYKAVHQHLSKGAQTLCSDDLAQMLEAKTMPLIGGVIDGDPQHTVTSQKVASSDDHATPQSPDKVVVGNDVRKEAEDLKDASAGDTDSHPPVKDFAEGGEALEETDDPETASDEKVEGEKKIPE